MGSQPLYLGNSRSRPSHCPWHTRVAHHKSTRSFLSRSCLARVGLGEPARKRSESPLAGACLGKDAQEPWAPHVHSPLRAGEARGWKVAFSDLPRESTVTSGGGPVSPQSQPQLKRPLCREEGATSHHLLCSLVPRPGTSEACSIYLVMTKGLPLPCMWPLGQGSR